MNPNGLVMASGEGAVWSMEPGRKSVLKLQNRDTEQSVMMFEETAPVGTVTPMHLHHDSDEVAYVLSGEITFKIGDQVTVGGPGTCAFLPRTVRHAWKNSGAEAARVLFLYTPAAAGRLVEEHQRTQHLLASMSEGEKGEQHQRYGWEILGPNPL